MLRNLEGTLHLQTFLFTYTVSASYPLFATSRHSFHLIEAMQQNDGKVSLSAVSLSS